MADYFIGDFHFGDPNIMMYEGRPFSSLEKMQDVMCRNWNETVSEDDTGWVLGDVGSPEPLLYLRGHIVVVMGNHDDYGRLKEVAAQSDGRIEISRYPVMTGGLWLSHEPIGFMPPQIPYLNVHAHTHRFSYGLVGRTWADGNRYFCASAEQLDYRPISADDIAKRMEYKRM